MFSTKGKLKNCVGLYISFDAIYLSDLRFSPRGFRIVNYVKIPIAHLRAPDTDVGQPSELYSKFFEMEQFWLEPIKRVLDKLQLSSNKMVITFSPDFVVFRFFPIPFINRRFWRTTVPREAKKYAPFDFSKSIYDYYAFPMADPGTSPKLAILFSIISKQTVDSVVKGCQKLGFDVIAVEASSASIIRLFSFIDDTGNKEGKIYTHFDKSMAYLLMVYNGVPIFYREVNFGDTQATERRKLDVRGAIEYVTKLLGKNPFEDVMLSSENADLWKPVLEHDAKKPVVVWSPKDKVQLKQTQWGSFAVIGAALEPKVKTKVLMNFVKDNSLAEEISSTKTLFVTLGIIAWLYMLINCSVLFLGMINKQKSLGNLTTTTETIPEFANKDAGQIQAMVRDVKSNQNTINSLLTNKDQLTPKLQTLVDIVPDKLWLSKVLYRSNSGRRNKANGDMELEGAARTGNAKTEVDLIESFVESIRTTAPFSDLYGTTRDGIKSTYRADTTSTGGQDDTEFDDSRSTKYTIACVSR